MYSFDGGKVSVNDFKLSVLLSWEFNPKLKSATTGFHSRLLRSVFVFQMYLYLYCAGSRLLPRVWKSPL